MADAKIPALDDAEGQMAALQGALSSALLTATEVPAMSIAPMLEPIVKQLHAYGIRQTDLIDTEAAYAPSWLQEGVKANAAPTPELPDVHEAEPPVVRTAEAPKIPKRIPKSAIAEEVSQ